MLHIRALLLPLLLTAASGVLFGCGGSGGDATTQAPTSPPVQEARDSRYQLLLVDAVSSERISDPLQLSFVSQAALTAGDGRALAGQTVTVNDGIFALNAAFTATAREFTVQVADRAENGWVATGQRIVGREGTTGDQLVEIRLVNTGASAQINASTKPIAMAVQTATADSTGALTAAVAQETAPKTVTNAEGQAETIGVAKMDIPTGTRGTTASGQAAAAGPLTVSTTYFSNANADSLAAFPGGFAANVEVPAGSTGVLNGASATSGTFITGGFAQFNITDSAGNPITQFSQPITVGIDLPKTSRDLSGNLLTVGSQYPVWSYNEANGRWVFERMGTVREKVPADPNNYTVEFTTTHLSAWNLDFYGESCTAQINLAGRPAGDARPLTIEIVGTTGSRYGATVQATDSAVTLYRAPSINATIVVRDGETEVGRVTGRPLCGDAISVPVTLPALVVGTINVTTREACSDGTQGRALPTYVWVYSNNVWTSGYSSTNGGVASVTFSSLRPGSAQVYAYDARAGVYVIQTVTVAGDATVTSAFTFTMPCRPVTGGS